MSRHLVLFTTAYPFGSHETFLEAELSFLSKTFDRVTLIPMSGVGPVRSVPKNVHVADALYRSNNERRALYPRQALRLKFWTLFLAEALRSARSERRLSASLVYRVALWSFYRTALEEHASLRSLGQDTAGVVAYSYWGHVPSLAIPMLAARGIPCVVRYHGVDLYKHAMDTTHFPHRKARYFPWRSEISAVARNVFISNQGREHFRAEWPSASTHVFRLGTKDAGVKPARPNKSAPLTVVSCSNLFAIKRVPKIAHLVAALARLRPTVWHHFGAGNELPQIEKVLADAPPDLKYKLHGQVTNAEVFDFYRTTPVDLFVNLSLSEGIPVSLMEAMSFGIPVVATDVGGTGELFTAGQSGTLIDSDDAENPDNLADRILADLQPEGRLSQADPRAAWSRDFDAARNYKAFMDFLVSVSER